MQAGSIVNGVLKEERKKARATQQQIADFLGVDRSTYTYYETGKLRIPLSALKRLAEYYGQPVSYFFGESDRTITFHSDETPFSLKPEDREKNSAFGGEGAAAGTVSLTFEERRLLSRLRANSCGGMPGEADLAEEKYDDELLTYFADPDA